MSPLFDDRIRERTDPMRRDEPPFEFYDTSARPPFVAYREIVNRWLSEIPESDRGDILGRLRKGGDAQYHAALTEVTVHAALVRLGWDVELHPACPHPSNRPDFLVRDRKGTVLGYVEVTSFGPGTSTTASANREAAFYHALDASVLPAGRRLRYSVVRRGSDTPSAARLRREVERWAAAATGSRDAPPPSRVFEAGDWMFELHLDAWSGAEGGRSIGADMRGLRHVDPAGDIRDALALKADRYGIEAEPYLVVVADCKGSIPTRGLARDSLVDAMFGKQIWRVGFDCDRRVASDELDRADDGFWGRHGAPRRRNVGGVLLVPDPGLLRLRDPGWQPLLALNPFATAPLDRRILPLPGFGPVDGGDGYGEVGGHWLADVLDLPDPWPPAG